MSAPDVAEALNRRLLETRIIVLGGPIDDTTANLACSQLLILEADDPEADITLYINSPGGSVDAGFAIYDTMRLLGCDVATVAMGLAASMGQFLLCAGTPRKRYALRHSRILMHQPLGELQGVATDVLVHASQFGYLRRLMAERLAEHTGQSVERITADFDRDRWFTAEEAMAYGMVDAILEHRSQLPLVPPRPQWAPAGSLQPVVLPPPSPAPPVTPQPSPVPSPAPVPVPVTPQPSPVPVPPVTPQPSPVPSPSPTPPFTPQPSPSPTPPFTPQPSPWPSPVPSPLPSPAPPDTPPTPVW